MGFPQHFIFLARSIQNFFILFLLFDYEFRQFLSLSVGVRSVVCVSFCIAVECSTTEQKFNMLRKKRKNQQQQQFWQTKHRVWIKARTIVSTNNISGTNARIQRTERKKNGWLRWKKKSWTMVERANERTNVTCNSMWIIFLNPNCPDIKTLLLSFFSYGNAPIPTTTCLFSPSLPISLSHFKLFSTFPSLCCACAYIPMWWVMGRFSSTLSARFPNLSFIYFSS